MDYWRTLWKERDRGLWLALLRIAAGLIFAHSGWGKVTNPDFVGGMAQTLGYFASQNPYPWMQSLLQGVAIPNAHFFGVLFAWGELLVGLSLLLGFLTPLGVLGALAMNLTFLFAAGWTSPSTATANQIMIVVGAVMLLSPACRVLSVDQLLNRLYQRLLPWCPYRLEGAPGS